MEKTTTELVFPRTVEVIPDGLATAFTGNDFVHRTFTGGIYRPDGSKVALADRQGAENFLFRQENPDRIDPAQIKAATRLAGRTLYLGSYIPQFGHFLAETLSTFWIFEEQGLDTFDNVAFHPQGHGTAIPAYVRHCLECFGIDPERIVFLNEGPVRFDEVTVPSRLVKLGKGAHPGMEWVYGHIREQTQARGTPLDHKRIYLSRRHLKTSQMHRSVANENRLEEMFASYGFEIVYPERLSFPEQILTCGNAEVLAGLSGSALANSLFMRPRSTVFQMPHPRLRSDMAEDRHFTQALSHRDVVIPFRGTSLLNHLLVHFDVDYVEARLRETLGADAGSPRARNRSLPDRIGGALEIGWRDLRTVAQAATGKVHNAIHRAKRTGSKKN